MKILCLLYLTVVVNANLKEVKKGGGRLEGSINKKYAPSWADLDTRPLPQWYDEAKVGIFLHWGVYSVPSYGSEWFWSNWAVGDKGTVEFMKMNYPPNFTYQEFGPMFTAEFFQSDLWAELFLKSGARYIVLTSKHHDGYSLYPSKRSFGWNSVDVGPKRDLVGDLAKAVRDKGLKFGVYHSLYEWFNPIYVEDRKTSFVDRVYPEIKLWPDIKQIIEDYQPSVLWSDGDWEPYDTYWNSTGLLAWLYNDSPVREEIVVNDRWGIGTYCRHGDFYNCADRFNPGQLRDHKWENAFTIDKYSWAYRRNMALHHIMTMEELLYEVVSTVSCGGNVLINVGPTKEGTIVPIFQERLLGLGKWLQVNGEAIYGTSPWLHQNDTLNGAVWYTCRKTAYNAAYPTAVPTASDTVTAIYAVFLQWPKDNVLYIKDIAPYLHEGYFNIKMLGSKQNLEWDEKKGVAYIGLPDKNLVKSENAWALKFSK